MKSKRYTSLTSSLDLFILSTKILLLSELTSIIVYIMMKRNKPLMGSVLVYLTHKIGSYCVILNNKQKKCAQCPERIVTR